jgi:NAD(P)-dependent dehydrogenase (short-subunit alcohol dehydrogenase family)
MSPPVWDQLIDLRGATILLTGATDGIGRETAGRLAGQAQTLLVHGPQPPEAVRDLVAELRSRAQSPERTIYLQADYTELAQVRRLAAEVHELTDHLDLLVNNAGRAGPGTRTVSRDGNEVTLQTNYLAAVALTESTLDLMRGRRPSRILNVASATHSSATLHLDDLNLEHHPYSPVIAYSQSKLALVTYTCWLAERLRGSSCRAVSLHPGVIDTRLLRTLFGIGGDPASRGAANIIYAATAADGNGAYFDEQRLSRPHPDALDQEVQERLHRVTQDLLTPSR